MTPDERRAVAILSSFIAENRYDTAWSLEIDAAGLEIDLAEHSRLTRAQFFHDSDYAQAIHNFLQDAYESQVGATRELIASTIGTTLPDDERLLWALATLGVIDQNRVTLTPPRPRPLGRYLAEITEYPDDFYRDLVELIDRVYRAEAYAAIPILLRKLFEALLVDITRLHFGMTDVNIFFDVAHSRPHDFSILLENARTRLNAFHIYRETFNEGLLNLLDRFREVGNATAHSIVTRLSKTVIDGQREDAQFAIKSLFRMLRVLGRPSQ